MTTGIVAPPRAAAVQACLNGADRWIRGRRKSDGLPFWAIPSSTGEHVYCVTSSACTCPDARERGRVCKHSLAVQRFEASQQPAPAPKPRPSYADLFPACRDCGDLADGLDNRCSRCASDREWEARREARSR